MELKEMINRPCILSIIFISFNSIAQSINLEPGHTITLVEHRATK